ncbi:MULTISPECIES: FtsH protease activity modulator HflK [unclassified Shewanella]|uniref:FtsH protease activity modulator HflK n=1 Tax=unclassified Shewanella TaxID=196818 RepID=UPI001BBFD495|nr:MULTISPECIES: FtsH protease activity modulator HflK [unclassified Shewanella]GIU06157.1 protease modulator HflK [Shewanella sp. MBTL60-112-B1]GIU25365.1 protease modulator HflK [Shewanella sp. MBTL60-112-B2]
MAWNEPGNKGQDPWGNGNKGGNDKGPPDLDEVFRNLSKRFGGKGNGSGGNISAASLIIVLVIAIVVWGLSGFYTVKEAEKGVALRFGAYIGEVDPGLQWKATFIDEVTPVNVQTVRSIPASGSMLTADENVVLVQLDVQYRVSNAENYLYSVVDADASLREATDSALRYVIGHNTMDDILTTGRDKIRRDTWDEIERIIKPYKLGITVVDVNFLPARPPEEVKDAFDDAIAAQEDEQRFIREAEAYSRQLEPQVRGTVERMDQQAIAYRQRVTLEAKGKVARFEQLLPEYQAAPEVTRERMYFDTMQEVMSGTSKVLIDAKNNGNLMYLPLDKLMQHSQSNKSAKSQSKPATPVMSVNSTTHNNSNMPLDGRPSRGDRSSGRN